jgi:hypothetical protein
MNDSGQIGIKGSSAGGLSNVSSQSYNDGNWHYVVVVGDSANTELYVDGQLVAESNSPKTLGVLGRWSVGYGTATNTGNLSSNYFAGTVSDVAFSDFDLQASQIQAQYSASAASG